VQDILAQPPSERRAAVAALGAPAVETVFSRAYADGDPRAEAVERAVGPSPDPEARNLAEGLWDGIRATGTDIWSAGELVYELMTEPERLDELTDGISRIAAAVQDPATRREALEMIGTELGEGYIEAFQNFGQEPWYHSGFIAGNLLAGGAITKVAKLGRLASRVDRLVDRVNGRGDRLPDAPPHGIRPDGRPRQTGATGSRSYDARDWELAERDYDRIRASTTDVDTIAARSGLDPDDVREVKAHLFEREHLLDSYVDHGVEPEWARFDAHPEIAAAWRRLEAGEATASDLQLFRHELAEATYMRENGPSYRAAHAYAQRVAPSPLQ
jgi:hypothetical protein